VSGAATARADAADADSACAPSASARGRAGSGAATARADEAGRAADGDSACARNVSARGGAGSGAATLRADEAGRAAVGDPACAHAARSARAAAESRCSDEDAPQHRRFYYRPRGDAARLESLRLRVCVRGEKILLDSDLPMLSRALESEIFRLAKVRARAENRARLRRGASLPASTPSACDGGRSTSEKNDAVEGAGI